MTENNYQHHLAIGTVLADEYRVEKILGEGGFGVTYLATDLNIGRKFAIKEYMPGEMAVRTGNSTVVPKSQSEKENFQWGLDRFLDEARTLANFNHPNLNQVNRFFKANGTAYMVLEFVEGETLSDYLKRQSTISEEELANLLKCLLGGLEVVHAAGYTHRDIKPGNIMIKPDGTPVLLDFGAARQALGYKSKSITAILTPGYAPIEQYDTKADDIGPWTDIYSMGMVAYQCVSGCKSRDLIEAVARGALVRKNKTDQDLTSAVIAGKGRYADKLLQAIDWSIQVYEEDRPQSVAQWREKFASVPTHDSSVLKSPVATAEKINTVDTVEDPVPAIENDEAKSILQKIWTTLIVGLVFGPLAGGIIGAGFDSGFLAFGLIFFAVPLTLFVICSRYLAEYRECKQKQGVKPEETSKDSSKRDGGSESQVAVEPLSEGKDDVAKKDSGKKLSIALTGVLLSIMLLFVIIASQEDADLPSKKEVFTSTLASLESSQSWKYYPKPNIAQVVNGEHWLQVVKRSGSYELRYGTKVPFNSLDAIAVTNADGNESLPAFKQYSNSNRKKALYSFSKTLDSRSISKMKDSKSMVLDVNTGKYSHKTEIGSVWFSLSGSSHAINTLMQSGKNSN